MHLRAGAHSSRCSARPSTLVLMVRRCAGLDFSDPVVIDTIVHQYQSQSDAERYPDAHALAVRNAVEVEVEAAVAKRLAELKRVPNDSSAGVTVVDPAADFESTLAAFYSDYVEALASAPGGHAGPSGAFDTGIKYHGTYRVTTGNRHPFFSPFPHSRPYLLARQWHPRSSLLREVRSVEQELSNKLQELGIDETEPSMSPTAEGAAGDGEHAADAGAAGDEGALHTAAAAGGGGGADGDSVSGVAASPLSATVLRETRHRRWVEARDRAMEAAAKDLVAARGLSEVRGLLLADAVTQTHSEPTRAVVCACVAAGHQRSCCRHEATRGNHLREVRRAGRW